MLHLLEWPLLVTRVRWLSHNFQAFSINQGQQLE
jgi:hypothetical protein